MIDRENPVARAVVPVGLSQYIGQALSPDKVIHWLMPVVGRLISCLVARCQPSAPMSPDPGIGDTLSGDKAWPMYCDRPADTSARAT
jgi:hypothetical protein